MKIGISIDMTNNTAGGVNGNTTLLTSLPLLSGLEGKYVTAPTFTRNSGQYGTGDSIIQQAINNSPLFTGLRGVTNLLTESEFRNGLTDAPVRSANITATTLTGYAGALYYPAGTSGSQYAYKNTFFVVPTRKYLLSADIQMEDLSIPRGGTATNLSNVDMVGYVSNAPPSAYIGYIPLGGDVYRLFWTAVASTASSSNGIVQGSTNSDKAFKVSAYQLVDITGIPDTKAVEYVQTTTAQVTKFYTYTNSYTVSGGIISQGASTALTSQGILLEPAATNKCTCYGVPRADSYGSTLNSGTATKGKVYEIVTRTSVNWDSVGTLLSGTSNTVGAQYLITGSLTFTANDTGKECIDRAGTKAYYDTAFNNPITNMTLSGDTAAVLSIVDDTAELTSAGLLGVCNGGKVYKLDNSAGSGASYCAIGGATGNTNVHSGAVYARKASTASPRCGWTATGGAEFGTVTLSAYTRVSGNNQTPSTTGQFEMITCIAGAVCYFILPQLEESPFATSITPSAGSAGSRIATVLSEPVSGNLPVGTVGVTNLVRYSQDFSNAVWAKAGTYTVTGTNVLNFPAGGGVDYSYQSAGTASVGSKYLFAVKMSGSGTISLWTKSGASGTVQYFTITLTSTPTVFSNVITSTDAGTLYAGIIRKAGDTATQVTCDWYQVEDVTTSGKTAFTTYTYTAAATATDYPTTRHISFNWTPRGYSAVNPTASTAPPTQVLWSTRVDALNSTSIWYNGQIVAVEKRVGGVYEYATYPLTATIGTTYKIDAWINADNTLALAVNGSRMSSDLGAELISPYPLDFIAGSWGVTNATKDSATAFSSTSASVAYITKALAVTGHIYRFYATGTPTSGVLEVMGNSSTGGPIGGMNTDIYYLKLGAGSIGFRMSGHTHPATSSGCTISIKEVYNNSTTMAPQIGTTMEIGSLNGVSNFCGNINSFAIYKR